MVSTIFTKNQDAEITLERTTGWGSSVLNRRVYTQWNGLGSRLGMTRETSDQVQVLRRWMEQEGPHASVSRRGAHTAGPSRRRSYGSAFQSGQSGSYSKRFRE